MILSIPSTAKLYACSTTPRVSASHSSSRISYFVKSVGCGGARRRSRSSCLLFCASNPWGTAEMLDERKSSSNAAAATPAVGSSSASDHHDVSPPRSFLDARSEQGPSSFNKLFEVALILYSHVFFWFLVFTVEILSGSLLTFLTS